MHTEIASSAFTPKKLHLLPKAFRFEHGGEKLVSCPGRYLNTLLRSALNQLYKCPFFVLPKQISVIGLHVRRPSAWRDTNLREESIKYLI